MYWLTNFRLLDQAGNKKIICFPQWQNGYEILPGGLLYLSADPLITNIRHGNVIKLHMRDNKDEITIWNAYEVYIAK